jgi:hypothetical protein
MSPIENQRRASSSCLTALATIVASLLSAGVAWRIHTDSASGVPKDSTAARVAARAAAIAAIASSCSITEQQDVTRKLRAGASKAVPRDSVWWQQSLCDGQSGLVVFVSTLIEGQQGARTSFLVRVSDTTARFDRLPQSTASALASETQFAVLTNVTAVKAQLFVPAAALRWAHRCEDALRIYVRPLNSLSRSWTGPWRESSVRLIRSRPADCAQYLRSLPSCEAVGRDTSALPMRLTYEEWWRENEDAREEKKWREEVIRARNDLSEKVAREEKAARENSGRSPDITPTPPMRGAQAPIPGGVTVGDARRALQGYGNGVMALPPRPPLPGETKKPIRRCRPE